MTAYDRTAALKVIRAGHLARAANIYDAAALAGLFLPAACAVIEKETHGANEYGHDAIRDAQGNVTEWGMLSGFPDAPNASNFAAFWYMVNTKGALSNGVGPTQITSRGLLAEMRGLLARGVPETALPFTGLVYKQALEHLHGIRGERETRELIVRENRRYSRRQMIWFRKEPGVEWFDGPGERAEVQQAAIALLEKKGTTAIFRK